MPKTTFRLATLVTLLLGLLLPSTVLAQTTSGTIKGEIVDQSDEPMAEVKLTLTGDNLIGGAQTNVTGEDGRFRFLGLPPGEYRLDAEKEGFKTIIRTNLQVSMGRNVSVRLVMEVPEVGETVEVIDKRPVVDTEQTAQSITFNTEFLSNLPTGRSFQDVVQFLPGVTGGANPNINGGTLQSNSYYLDGTNTTDPVTGTFAMNFNFDAIEDLEVITAGYDARYNQGLGGTINIVTKSGGNTFEGDFSAYYRTTAFQARGGEYAPITDPGQSNSVQAYGSLGGPIIKDRFWFFASYQFTHRTSWAAPRADLGRDYGLFPQTPQRTNFHGMLIKLTAQPIARHKFTLTFRADPGGFQNSSQSASVVPEAEQLWRQGGFSTVLQHQATLGGWGLLTTTVNYQYSTIRVQPMLWKDCENRTTTGLCTDEDKQISARWGNINGLDHGSFGRYDLDRRHRFSAQMDFVANIDRLLGSHQLSAGASVEPIWTRRDFGYINNQVFLVEPQDLNGDGVLIDTTEVSDLNSYENVGRFVIANLKDGRESGITTRIYAQDRWVPTRGLTVNLGASFLISRLRNNAGDSVINTTAFTWGPSIAWDPMRDGKTNLSVSFAQIVDPGILTLSSFLNNQTFNAERFNWDAAQRKYDEQSARAQTPANNVQHSDIVPARSNEVFVRAQREIARDMSAEVNFIYRRFTNSWEDDEVNVIWNRDGTDSVGFRNGGNSEVQRLRTPQDGRRNYYAFSLLVRKQLSDNLELFGSYTFSRLVANTAGRGPSSRVGTSGDFDNPTQRYVENGIAGGDQPHVLRLLVSYDNPNVWKVAENFSIGYGLGATFELASGPPINRLKVNEFYGRYSNYVVRRGTSERLPATSNLDLRGSLGLSIAGTQIDVIVQVFNVLNSTETVAASQAALTSDDEVVEVAGIGPAFALPIAFQAGRRFELGLRFHF
ncbi:MAG: carboxypeptidase regulatory-like domain-containing protein [Deltaproteobacteria bacterium]|nr:carboxypeptidase regulatory-like domain-containing protein [Deltaproteobacteria bacterium]